MLWKKGGILGLLGQKSISFICPYVNVFLLFLLPFVFLFSFSSLTQCQKKHPDNSARHSTAEYLQGQEGVEALMRTFREHLWNCSSYKTWILNHYSEKLELIYLQSKNFHYLFPSSITVKVTCITSRQHS